MLKRSLMILCLSGMVIAHASLPNVLLSPINYYVSLNGNDNNPGTSMAQPFRTIGKGLSKVQAGGTVFVQGSLTPYLERLLWPTSGTSSGIITLTSYDTNPVYVSGAAGGTNNSQNALLLISSKSNIRINNIRFNNNYRLGAEGVQIQGAGTNIQLDNCYVYNVGWTSAMSTIPTNSNDHNAHGIFVKGTSSSSLNAISITNCYLYNLATGFSESLTITGNVYNFFLNNNWVHDVTNIGIDIAGHYPNAGVPANVNFPRTGTIRGCTVYNCNVPSTQMDIPAGIYIDGANDVIIEGNRSYRNGVGFSIGCEVSNTNSQLINMRDNIATDNSECGLFLGSSNPTSTILNCKVTNNTFAQNYSKNLSGAEVSLYNSANSVVKQNIFLPRRLNCVAIGTWNNQTISNFSSSYNLYWRLGGDISNMTASVTPGTNAVYGDPKFVSTTLPSPNYHLQTGSKAINKGDAGFSPGSGELDIDAQARIQSGRVDIGADESNLSTLSDTVEERVSATGLHSMVIFPNPATTKVQIQFPEPYSGSLQLYNIVGTLLEEKTLANESEISLSINNLSTGIYFIRTSEKTVRFVKE